MYQGGTLQFLKQRPGLSRLQSYWQLHANIITEVQPLVVQVPQRVEFRTNCLQTSGGFTADLRAVAGDISHVKGQTGR